MNSKAGYIENPRNALPADTAFLRQIRKQDSLKMETFITLMSPYPLFEDFHAETNELLEIICDKLLIYPNFSEQWVKDIMNRAYTQEYRETSEAE